MLEWINANSGALNFVANTAMVAIWLAYFEVFLRGFRRQTQPKIVINRAAGSALDAACFVSNMSSEAIYIESVIVDIRTAEASLSCTVTDIDVLDGEEPVKDPRQRTHQGSLGPAQYMSLGSFDDLISRAARKQNRDPKELSSGEEIAVEITIIADYASEKLPIGAKRQFRADWQENCWALTPVDAYTTQIRSRWERARLLHTDHAAG